MAKAKIEFGDFQTPRELAMLACERLVSLNITPTCVVEPTCGLGAFVVASANKFNSANRIIGVDINEAYIAALSSELQCISKQNLIDLKVGDFFSFDWKNLFSSEGEDILIVGNLPWVTNTVQSKIDGNNIPNKDNVVGLSGFDAISGKANFDISEWMMISLIKTTIGNKIDIAMMLKTSVARKILSYIEKNKIPCCYSEIIFIDAKKEFGASVDACFFIVRFNPNAEAVYDYRVFESFADPCGRLCGHRDGYLVSDIESFNESKMFISNSPQKWRSGVKHDASAVMELKVKNGALVNGFDEVVDIEDEMIYPLIKGSIIGSGKDWNQRYAIVTQYNVGGDTDYIKDLYPKAWEYLNKHASQLDGRKSVIYKNNPRFSIFGVGEYTFKPWKIAICGLYKKISFTVIGPINGKAVVFDDTVYFVSFETEEEANAVFEKLCSDEVLKAINSMIFWDEKRPIKAGILNVINWAL